MNGNRLEYRARVIGAAESSERPLNENSLGNEIRAASVVIIENRALLRECLLGCFRAELGPDIAAFVSVDDWLASGGGNSPCALVLSIGDRSRKLETIQQDIARVARLSLAVTLVLLADAEEPSQIVAALEKGARGYIPTSSSLAIAIEAVRLVKAGGVYVPASSLLAANRRNDELVENGGKLKGYFTTREIAVLDGLSCGKPNKVIAGELKLQESTVKVHVRNMMKKLGARSRTEVVYRANQLKGEEHYRLGQMSTGHLPSVEQK